MAIDFTTNIGKVRLLSGDTYEEVLVMSDAELTAILLLQPDLYLAAAQALDIMATKHVLIHKKIKTLDLQTDGPAVAKALSDLATKYREHVASLSSTVEAPFTVIEMVHDSFGFLEFHDKRGGTWPWGFPL